MYRLDIVYLIIGLGNLCCAEISLQACHGIQCLNGGTMEILNELCVCRCPTQVSGLYCEYELQNSVWPKGPFVIPMTKDGCPEPISRGWGTGYINFTAAVPFLSLTPEGKTDVLPLRVQDLNILGPFGKHTIQLNFCYRTNAYLSSEVNQQWPAGNYSLYGTDEGCPSGFQNTERTIRLPPLLQWNSDGYLPNFSIERREDEAILQLRTCRRNITGEIVTLPRITWNSSFILLKDQAESCTKFQEYEVVREILNLTFNSNGSTSPDKTLLNHIEYCFFTPINMSHGSLKSVNYFDPDLADGDMAIFGSRVIKSERYKNDLNDISVHTGLYELRTKFHFSCYQWTTHDRHLLNVVGLSEADLCERYPYHIWIGDNNDKYPGCDSCSCCQIPGCFNGKSFLYNGTWDKTKSGHTCQHWSSNYPHSTNIDSYYFPRDEYYTEALNYCRDPQLTGFLWCYTTNDDVRWETCNIPHCEGTEWSQCYSWTDNDLQALQAGIGLSELCESYQNNVWTRGQNDRYPHCGTCSCCRTKGCYDHHTDSYNGTWDKTVNARTCQRWDSQVPHTHWYAESYMFPGDNYNVTEAHNYCRDPSRSGYLWCYVNNINLSPAWEKCGIEKCSPDDTVHYDCYTLTDADKEITNKETSSSDRKVCESYSSHFWTDVNNETNTGCDQCSCCQRKDCYVLKSMNYGGTWSKTASGYTCQRWDSQYPHGHVNNGDHLFPNDASTRDANNYCRDPDSTGYIWCYTTSPSKRYEACDIPECKAEAPDVSTLNNNIANVPWILLDLGSAIKVSALKISLKLPYTYDGNTKTGGSIKTIDDIPDIYISNQKWSFLNYGANLFRYDGYFIPTVTDMLYMLRFFRPKKGRYISVFGHAYRENVNLLVYILRIRTVIVYTSINHQAAAKSCQRELGLTDRAIEDFQISASSSLPGYPPEGVRLQQSGWCADGEDAEPYIQIDLLCPILVEGITVANWGHLTDVSSETNIFMQAVVPMGCRSFNVMYGMATSDLKWYKTQPFFMDISLPHSTPQQFLFLQPFLARYIRLLPQKLLGHRYSCLKTELIGCRKSGFPSLVCKNDSTAMLVNTTRSFLSTDKPLTFQTRTSKQCADICVEKRHECSTSVKIDNICSIYNYSDTQNYLPVVSTDGQDISSFICWKDAVEVEPLLMDNRHVLFPATSQFEVTEETVLTSFGYPFHYEVNQVIKWYITFSHEQFITLLFSHLTLRANKEGDECIDMIVISPSESSIPILMDINNGDRGELYIDHRYNGHTPAIGTDMTKLNMIFNTCPLGLHDRTTDNGFRVIVTTNDIPTCSKLSQSKSPICEQSSMHIVSDSFSGIPILQSRNEYWTIGGYTSLRIIILHITEFNVMCTSGSQFEIGNIGPLSKKSIQAYCNKNKPTEAIRSKYDRMTIRFYYNKGSFSMMSKEGFKATYTTVAKPDMQFVFENVNTVSDERTSETTTQMTYDYFDYSYTNDGYDSAISHQAVCNNDIGKCYRVSDLHRNLDKTSWSDASMMCAGQREQLVTIHSETENQYIRLLMETVSRREFIDVYYDTNVDPHLYVYIGLYRDTNTNGKLVEQWVDGSPLTFTAWDDLQPSSVKKKQCTRMGFHLLDKKNTWETVNCLNDNSAYGAKYMICESPVEESNILAPDVSLGTKLRKTSVSSFEETSSFYLCKSGEWVSTLSRCNGLPDCIDGSDELGCSDEWTMEQNLCSNHMFRCDNGDCIHTSQVCDYIRDCDDGTDEFCDFPECGPSNFKCKSHQCVPGDVKCNGITDCLDGSDEMECDSCNSENAFQCNDLTCISIHHVCDNYADCLDNKDELSCDKRYYKSCDQWWEAGFRDTGLYEIDGQAVECKFDMFNTTKEVRTTYYNIDMKPRETSSVNTRTMSIDVNTTFVKVLKERAFGQCKQNIVQTCRPDMLSVAQFDGISTRTNSQCLCLLYDLNIKHCSNDTQDLQNPKLLSKFDVRIGGFIDPHVTFPEDIDSGIVLDIGPLECINYYTAREETFVCTKERKVIKASRRCLYDVDRAGNIDGCRSLEHLQNCEEFECPLNYAKCPGSFCIAARFVCDGENQCGGGEDEINCWCHKHENDIYILFHAAASDSVKHNVLKLVRQLSSPSGHVRVLTFSSNITRTHNIDSDISPFEWFVSEVIFTSLKDDIVNKNTQYKNRNRVNTFTTSTYDFIRNINNTVINSTAKKAIIYVQVENEGLNFDKVISSLASAVTNDSMYRVTEDRTLTKQAMERNLPNMKELRLRDLDVLGTIGATLFPDICGELREATCPNMYRCSASRVCIPFEQICNGTHQCPHGDDEHICNFTCPERCSCTGYNINCNDTGFQGLDFQNISSVTRTLDLSYNPTISEQNITISTPLHFLINLKMSACDLLSIPKEALRLMRNLLILDLSYNKIEKILAQSFSALNFLQQLILTGNRELHSLEAGAFAGLININTLTVSGTKLSKISKTSFSGLNLFVLDLSQNQIETVEALAFKDLKVKSINITGNDIQNVSSDMFKGVISLEQINSSAYKFCCIKPASVNEEDCLPRKDEFSSCEDLMRNTVLQTILWVIGISALVGNFLSLIYRLLYDRQRLKLGYGIFVTNLAVADFLMGVYLIIIAVADQVYRKRYIWMDEYWRNSTWCKMAGVLSTVSSEASVLFLCLITLDRLLVIKFPFGQLRINPKKAMICSIVIWFTVFCLAVVPLIFENYFHNNFYSRSAVCLALPLTRDKPPGWQYSIGIFIGFNFVTFLLIAIGQLLIYMEVRSAMLKTKRMHSTRRNDLTVARNLLLVVTTDFMCWFPIGCMGLMALKGHVISGEVYAWVAVLVLPINSALNPFLYTVPAILGRKKRTPNLDDQSRTDMTTDITKRIINVMDHFAEKTVNSTYTRCTLAALDDVRPLAVKDVVIVFHRLMKSVDILHKNDLVVQSMSDENVEVSFHHVKKMIRSVKIQGRPDVCYNDKTKAKNMLDYGCLLNKILAKFECKLKYM